MVIKNEYYNKVRRLKNKYKRLNKANKLYSYSFGVLACLFICSFLFNLISSADANNPIDEYTFVYYFTTVIITGVIAAIAYSQFKEINDNLAKDYLLKIDERWRGSEIIRARTVIHKLYIIERIKIERYGSINEKKLHKNIGIRIRDLSSKKDKASVESFILLLNFLDFMETIGYYYTTGKLKKKDLQELFGLSLKFNYEIFYAYIASRRKRHVNKKFYSEFSKLYKCIK